MPNLVRYGPAGTYYLRARFGGPAVREALNTDNYRVACARLPERMAALRAAALLESPENLVTLWDALLMVRARKKNDPAIKESTRSSYVEEIDSMGPGKPAEVPSGPLTKLSPRDMDAWWAKAAKAYAPQRANHLLMFVNEALKLARKNKAMIADPAEDLKRLKIPRTRLDLLSMDQFHAVVASVRAQGMSKSEQSADWIEFMAYLGVRPKEHNEVLVSDILEKSIRVTGGEGRTKNNEDRFVPIIPPMADLLERMKAGERIPKSGKLFAIKKPHDALTNACKRLGFPHQRIYDLRHLFATTCNASDVNVPTFAKWLGHKDGGALAMRTYIHPHNEHEQRAAAKVKF